MKKFMMMMLFSLVVSGASAQFRGHGRGGHFDGGFHAPRTTVIVRGGLGPYYYPYWHGYYGWGYPYYGYYYRPSKLDMQIADIKHDYANRISSVKLDRDLDRREKRGKIHELKVDRDNAIYNAKRTYYKS